LSAAANPAKVIGIRTSPLDAPIIELDELADLLAHAALLAAGFRRHNRGEWRKGREQPDQAG
jgi:hypothetical protein